MKAKLCTVFLVFVISGTAFAQISENLRFGFKTVPHVSWISTDDKSVESSNALTGLTLGTIAELYLSENYIITTGLGLTFSHGGSLIHRNGGRLLPDSELSDIIYDSLPDNSKIRYNVQYLEIPVGFRMRSKEFGRFRLTFEAPIITMGVKIKARGAIKADDLPDTEDENINNEVNIFNLSYGFGAGTEYTITENISLLVSVQYKQGILDITKDHGVRNDGKFEDSVGTIGHLALQIGILF
ncbi:MAG: porin family protein [Saprospiraceae bacterium]|nr:porin family protein [Saprospiraceae bacterium]